MNLLSYTEINLLIKLLLAHFISDFVLQNKWIIENKKPLALGMLLHIAITILTAGLITQLWWLALLIGLSHYCIDVVKYYANLKWQDKKVWLFIIDQILHILILLLVWALTINKSLILQNLKDGINQNQLLLIALGYVICIWPLGFIIGMATKSFIKTSTPAITNGEQRLEKDDVEHGGKIIGIFERIIILTFVLFAQYEAIGFLITGKSILRLNSKQQTEYVLAGTMVSYALAIVTGVLLNYFLKYV